MRSALGAFVLAALVACTQPAPAPPAAPTVDTAAVTQAAAGLWSRWIVADTAGNVDALLALIADDARFDLQGVPPVLGKAALDAVLRPMIAARKYTDAQVATPTTVIVSNDLVLQGGTYSETYIEKKKTSTEYGRFATSLVRGTDGQWRIAYLMNIIDSTVAAR